MSTVYITQAQLETMANLDEEISALKARICKFETDYDNASTPAERGELIRAIITSRETLKLKVYIYNLLPSVWCLYTNHNYHLKSLLYMV